MQLQTVHVALLKLFGLTWELTSTDVYSCSEHKAKIVMRYNACFEVYVCAVHVIKPQCILKYNFKKNKSVKKTYCYYYCKCNYYNKYNINCIVIVCNNDGSYNNKDCYYWACNPKSKSFPDWGTAVCAFQRASSQILSVKWPPRKLTAFKNVAYANLPE